MIFKHLYQMQQITKMLTVKLRRWELGDDELQEALQIVLQITGKRVTISSLFGEEVNRQGDRRHRDQPAHLLQFNLDSTQRVLT